MIALIDYGAGNLTSVKKALAAVGADVVVPSRPEQLASAHGVIVPGVGHFGATRALEGAWQNAIVQRIGEGRPVLGICLGMQWLFEGSDEAPDVAGLGVLAGRCYRLGAVRLKPDTTYAEEARDDERGVRLQPDRVKVPHVGWNSLAITRDASIVDGVAAELAGLLHARLRRAADERYRRRHRARRDVRVDRAARTDRRRAVSSGEVGGRRTAVLQNFLQLAG